MTSQYKVLFSTFSRMLAGILLLLCCCSVLRAEILVNGSPLNHAMQAFLESKGLLVADGRYWYDPVSGAWGYENGPVQGQVWPGLPVSSSLPADISAGDTGIYINGREITQSEKQALAQFFGYTLPGRYWINALGVGGREGEPPSFDISPMFHSLARQKGGSGQGIGHRARGGSVLGDGQIMGFISSDHGVSVTCTPGGGCIY